jgi:hypothetical protein
LNVNFIRNLKFHMWNFNVAWFPDFLITYNLTSKYQKVTIWWLMKLKINFVCVCQISILFLTLEGSENYFWQTWNLALTMFLLLHFSVASPNKNRIKSIWCCWSRLSQRVCKDYKTFIFVVAWTYILHFFRCCVFVN